MRKSLQKHSWLNFTFLFFFLTIISGCKKDLYEIKNSNAVNNSILQGLKSEFEKNNFQALLMHTVNDTIQINWVPDWEHASQKKHGDTLKYIYIPLNGQATSPHVKKAVKLRTVNNERYLIVTISKSSSTFKLASYDANGAFIKTGQKSQAINSTGAKKINYFNHTIPFNNFTGGLVTKDLKTGKQNSYYYLQGKNNNAAASIGGPKITTNTLSTNRLCLVTLKCHWFNNFPEYCGPEATYTERTSYINEGDTVYDTDCGGVPTETYMDGVNLCVPGWIYDGIEIVSSECQDDPTPPDIPPVDPGSGGSGGDGGNGGDPSTPPGSNDPDDATRCEEKNKLNAMNSNSVISSQHLAIFTNTQSSNNEYGVGHRLTSLTGNQYKNNAIQTNNSPDYVDITFTWNSTDGYTIGTSHGHPGGSTPSPQDIFAMVTDYHNSQLQNAPESDKTFYKNNVSTTVITSDYFFDITIKDWTALESLYAQYQANPTQFMDDYQTQVNDNRSDMGGLLKIFGNAVNAYYSDITDGRFIPLKLVGKTVLPIDCPQ